MTQIDAVADAVLQSDAPLVIARHFINTKYAGLEGRRLHYWRGDFYRWTGSHFAKLGMDAARAELYEWLDARAGKPTKRTVDNVLDALRAAAFLDVRPPCWLSKDGIQGELIACRNGLVHVATRELHEPTPAYFNLNACDFDYQAEPPRPARWLEFLGSLWGEDLEIISALQEIFGLLLTSDTSHQKIILLIGPKRSGKGTIARVLRAMIGADNTAAPTLAGLGQPFGLAGLIGKPLAVISDARLSGRSDLATVTENLLRISGEDGVGVPRKFQSDWVGQLPTRFLLLTNELPALQDASGALASRFVVLPMTESFYGREDPRLTARLLDELPGIFAWALEGLDRLHQRGHMLQPAAGLDVLEQLDRLASPIKAFIADCCVIEPAAEIACADLYAAWADWCQAQHRDNPGTVAMFGKHLHAAYPAIVTRQPRLPGGDRLRVFAGIRRRRPEESASDASGTRWHASKTIARVRPIDSKRRNRTDCVPARANLEKLVADIAQQAGIPADVLAANLSPEDLNDPELMEPSRLLSYARGLVTTLSG